MAWRGYYRGDIPGGYFSRYFHSRLLRVWA